MSIKFKQDILFIFPSEDGDFIYHLGVGYILTYLKQRGISGSFFISNDSLGMSGLMDSVADINPRVVGLTCFNSNYYLVKLIAKHLKLSFPQIKIVLGGPSATFSDLAIMNDCLEIDLCVRGEGEETIAEFLSLLKNGRNALNLIAGITFRDKGRIIQNRDRFFLGSDKKSGLDIFPSPFINNIINPAQMLKVNKEVSLLTSRGCARRCTYCNFASMSRYTVRYHSIKRIISELNVMRGSGVGLVSIQDDTFTLNRQHAQRLCRAIIKEKLDINFWLLTRSDTLDEDFLELLYKAGVRHLNFGLESASPRILYNIKKVRPTYSAAGSFLPERKFINHLGKIVGISKAMGFRVGVSIILGLPGETLKEGRQTLEFVEKLKVDTYAHNFLSIFPGTELFNTCQNYGLKLPPPKYNEIFNDPTVSPPRYKYNLNKIPRLKNEMQIQQKARVSFQHLPGALMGGYSRNKENYYPSEVIYAGNRFFAEWSRKNTAFHTATVYGVNLESLFTNKDDRIKIIIEKMSFHNRYLFMTPSQLERLRPLEAKKPFRVKRLDEVDFERDKSYNSNIYKFDFKNKCSNLFGSIMSGSKGYILDLCRWGNFCPALKNHRIIIDKYGNIFTCFSNRSIGNVKSIDLSGIKTEIRRIYLKIQRERKCAQCKVKDSCSKCLFLNGLRAAEYCSLRKKMPEISSFPEGIFMARKMESQA